MIGIKYIANVLPYSRLTKWQKSKNRNNFEKYIKLYIFNDIMCLIVHTAIAVLFGIFTNFFPDNVYYVMYDAAIYIGIIPMIINIIPYVIYALIIYPVKKFITWI